MHNTLKIRFYYFLLFSVLAFLKPIFASDDIYFSKIGIEQGLAQLTVSSIYQDELGYMWFGTREGISRFNGNSMMQIKPILNDSNSLSGNIIRNICGNRNGKVYIQTQRGLNEYDILQDKMSIIQRNNVDAIAYGIRNLWVAEGNKIYVWKDNKKTLFVEIKEISSPIRVVYETLDQRLVIGTTSSGLYIVDQNKKHRLAINNCSQVSSIYEDESKNLWIGTWQNGLYKIERNGNSKNYKKDEKNPNAIASNFVRSICEDGKHNLWIGTRRGLEKLNVELEVFTHYQSGESSSLDLSNESIWALYKDMQGTIWIGTYFGGVNYFYPDIDFYNFHNLNSGIFKNRPFPVISNIIEDKNGQLLLSTEGDGLIIYNPKTKLYQNIRIGDDQNSLSSDNIKTAFYDSDENVIWLGTHLGGITRVDLFTNKTTQLKTIRADLDQSNIVRAIVPFNEKLLVGTYNGLFLLDKKTMQFSLFSEKLHEKLAFITDLKIIGGEFYIGSEGMFRYNYKTGKLKSYHNVFGDSTSLSNNYITKIFIDSNNRVWIGTNGGGVNLFDPKNDKFKHYSSQNIRLKNDYVSNLMESKYGYLYIATTQGLSVLDIENNKLINYDVENGFPLNSLFNGGMLTRKSGEIFIAGMNGFVSFNEENLSITQRPFNLNLVNIWVNNELITTTGESGILKKSLPYTTGIKLNHKQRMLTIEFATNNYIEFNKPSYRYQLEGLSTSWIELPSGLQKLNFMNLKTGKYKLILQAFSPATKETIAETYLKIVVTPPFYLSWYAYLIYFMLAGFLIWRYILFIRSRLILQTSLEYEKKEKQQLEEVNQSKLRFFTNISHEFRTPLTLISGQLDMLMQMSNIQPTVFNRILNIKRNTLNMQNLINELLEFRKSEQGHLSIKIQKKDIVSFLYEIFLSFKEYANYRKINFDFKHAEQTIDLWFDPQQMQKDFYNLISNAFKYTSKEGNIEIDVVEHPENVVVVISDTGIGIESESIKHIFDRFFQVENGLKSNETSPGTGIGLSLTKNILDLHFADIQVESAKNIGTQFYVTLKKGKEHFSAVQIEDTTAEIVENSEFVGEIDTDFFTEIKETQLQNNEPIHSMLIVEDNEDLRDLLVSIFEPIYTVYTAVDGEEGLDKTLEKQPDIVLSDLMMPKMSGSEMCSKIKNNFLVSHIPVVLLTAQTAIEFNIEGLRLGADDYIIKPFHVKTLITRCNNLVNNRKALQEKFSKQIDTSPRLVATNKIDREFLEKATQIVENHLDNSSFDVQAFSNEMALGRTNLFTKIKGITGKTPNEFILNIRLKKAAFWLANSPEYNITDITYMLGFSTPKYFSKCFKEQFGVSPSAYRKDEIDFDFNEEEYDK
jgi:signal transduction histidine kinase/ligand-binding sensor domain-containing protein/DNA-binding response OmpR family regulator